MDSTPSRPASRRSIRWLLLFGLLVGVAGTLWGAYEWQRRRAAPGTDDAPARPASPYLNTRPGVQYVGSERCADCHAAEALTYAEHPMGRSVSPPLQQLPAQQKATPTFEADGLRYAALRKSGAVVHREFVAGAGGATPVGADAEVVVTIGSGQQGQSFVVSRHGRLFQSPISWYVGEQAWKLSPGFAGKNEHFNRPITEPCLHCHCNEAHAEPLSINHFQPDPPRLESIGCERCHGPGELHVAAHTGSDPPKGKDFTIVNPRHLSPALRDAVCEQCHLQGEARIVRAGRSLYDYRPGLPLEKFVAVYVRPPQRSDVRKAVSHVEQMAQSRCSQASGGALACMTCHDPHVLPSPRERVGWYRGRCLSCHQETSCRLAPAERRQHNAQDSCIDCHMPRSDSSNIAHTSITDHRIVRRRLPQKSDETPGDFSLVSFHASRDGLRPAGDPRDLGLALGEAADRPYPEAQRRQFARQACSLLRPAVERAPDDVAALERWGIALWMDKRPTEALGVLDRMLQKEPRRELALGCAALLALELGDPQRSIAYWRRLLEVNPHTWQAHGYLGQALALKQQWPEAVRECREALRIYPFEMRTRMLLIDSLIHLPDIKSARTEFETLLTLPSSKPEQLRPWFDELLRSGG
jgi:hypothetical protein